MGFLQQSARRRRRSGGAAPPDPDAAIAAILAGGVNMALDTTYTANMWQEDTKATQVSAGGQTVGALLTRFGTTGFNFLNATGANRPTWDSTGALVCNGSSQLLASTDGVGFLNAAPAAFFSVHVYVASLAAAMGIVGIGTNASTTSRFTPQINTDGSVALNCRRDDGDGNIAITSAAGLVSVGGYYVISGDVNPVTGAMRLWVDGVLVASGTTASTGAAFSATNSNRFRVGRTVGDAGGYFNGNIRRLVLARKTISDADRATIETWVGQANLTSNGYYIADGGRTMALNDPSMFLDSGRVLVGLARESSLPSRIIGFDLSTKRASTLHVTTTTTTGGDDHDDAVALKLDNGSYIVGSVAHNSATFQIARGSSMTGLSEANIAGSLGVSNLSYCNLYQLEGETNDPIYLFGRGGSPWSARYSVSTDNGATWGAYTIWCENGANRPYVQYCKTSSTRIDFILTEGHPDTLATSIYHGYFEGGAFYKTDGTAVGALPINPASFTQVFDGTAAGGSWVWDLKRINGELVAAFTSFPSTTAHRYHRAVLSGTSWTVETVVSDAGTNLYSGEPYYSGGLCLHPTNKDLLYCSVGPVGAHQIYPYTRDGGGTWTQGSAITSGSPRSFRPATVAGLLTFVRGTYTSYTSFADCKIMGVLI